VRIVLTRESGRNVELRGWLPGDARVDEVALTTTHYYDEAAVERELRTQRDYGSFAALVVTSARSERFLGLAIDALAPDAPVFSVGAATTRALVRAGVRVRHEARAGAAGLAGLIARGPVLLIGARVMREELPAALEARGIAVHRAACYETRPAVLDEEQTRTVVAADVLVIGAPSAWAAAREFVRPATWVVVPGATTASEVRAEHGRVIEAWGPELATALDALERP